MDPQRKRLLMIVGGAIGTLLLAFVIFMIYVAIVTRDTGKDDAPVEKKEQVIQIKTICSDDMARRVSPAIANSDIEAIRRVFNEFRANNDYKDDATCNYIAVRYFIATGNDSEASAQLDQMRKTVQAGGIVSSAFDPPAQPFSTLEQTIATIKQSKSDGNTLKDDDLNDVDKAWNDSFR